MPCKFCGNTVEWVSVRRGMGEVLDRYRWLCNHCGRHECNGKVQLSVKEVALRKLKREAHTLVDYYWQIDAYERLQVYMRIKKILGIRKDEPVHISRLTEQQLLTIIRRVREGTFLWYKRM